MSSTNERSLRPGVVIIVTIAAFTVAGFVAYRSVSQSKKEAAALAEANRLVPQDRPKPKRIVPPPHPASFRTRLALSGVGDAGTGFLLTLSKPTGSTSPNETSNVDQGIILRELIRQAMLMAARDELGLSTRDEVIDESVIPAAQKSQIELDSVFRVDGPSRVLIRRGEGEDSEVLLDHEMGAVPNEIGVLAMVLPLAEELSRKEFLRTLKTLGAKGSPNAIRADAPIPPGVEASLMQVDFIEIFSAVRRLHAALRDDGESPARIGALARAYSLLGILSEYQWHPAHKAYKARALLYAQRLVARDPSSAWAFRNRAFVRALIGIPQEALDDLTAANKLAKAANDTAPPPDWVSLIDSYSRYDLKALENNKGPYSRLAALLRLVMLEYPVGYPQAIKVAREILVLEPFCPRASDSLCRTRRLGVQHEITLTAPQAYREYLPIKLKALSDLPGEVCERLGIDEESRESIEELGRRAVPGDLRFERSALRIRPVHPRDSSQEDQLAIIAGFSRAGVPGKDRGEPPWSALAHLLRETQFVHAYRRLDFLKTMLGAPVGDYLAEVKPFVEGHRYLPYLVFLSRSIQEGRADFTEFAKKIDLSEAEWTEFELLTWMDTLRSPNEPSKRVVALMHNDAVVPDLSAIPNIYPQTSRVVTIKSFLMPIAPDWPFSNSVLIDIAWEIVKPKAAAWESSPDTSPIILAALGKHYAAAGQFEEAERVLRRYISHFPERWSYELLAETCKNRGDMERWRAVLDEYLIKGENLGLDHSVVQAKIAHQLMDRKKWAEAKPYADAAASTGSGDGTLCAIRCAEGMEDWKKSEALCGYLLERYPEHNWGEMFLYCKRTGRGDLAAARKHVEDYLGKHKVHENSSFLLESGFFYWMTGDLKHAVERLSKEYEWTKDEMTNLHVAMVADEMHDYARRDAILSGFCERFKAKGDPWVSICERMKSDLSSNKVDPYEDVAAFDQLLGAIPANWRPTAYYFVGRYFLNRGRIEVAQAYLGRCADSPMVNRWIRAIASEIIRSSPGVKAK